MHLQPPYQLAIVLPMCKPRRNWQATLINNIIEVEKALPDVSIQFIVVNDGFENPELLIRFALLNEAYTNLQCTSYGQNKGKGFALRTGVLAALAPYVITTDIDFPYLTKNLVNMYQQLLKGYQIVAGKRTTHYYQRVPLKRKVISMACVLGNRILLNLPDCDAQSGLKGFNAAGRKVFLSTTINRFMVDTEFLTSCYRQQMIVKIIPLELKPFIEFSGMGVKVLLTETKNLLLIVKRLKLNREKIAPNTNEEAAYLPDLRFRRI